MNPRIVSILILLIVSCQANPALSWHTLDFGAFKLKAPKTWNKFRQNGTDAYVGGVTNGRDSLWFYYGWYISGPTDAESGKHLYAQDTINGYTSVIMVPKRDSLGSIQLFIPHVSERDKFALSGYNIKDKETVLDIFKTVSFPTSDTTKNSTLTTSKFKKYPFGSGRTLFYASCSPCHRLGPMVDGPHIQDLIKGRSPDWVYLFLTNRKQVAHDTLYLERHKEFGASCMEFDSLSRQDVQQIVGYIKGE